MKAGKYTEARVFILKPMRFKAILATLKRFTPPGSRQSEKLGVVVFISRNPLLKSFLVFYPLMIVGIWILLGITWRNTRIGEINVKNNSRKEEETDGKDV